MHLEVHNVSQLLSAAKMLVCAAGSSALTQASASQQNSSSIEQHFSVQMTEEQQTPKRF